MSANLSSEKQTVKIGTRGSRLALVQAEGIAAQLKAAHPDKAIETEIRVISTLGDRSQKENRALSEIGGKGLFTLEIEEQLTSGEIDLAVHLSKDMPTTLPQGLDLVCFTEREDPSDAFISEIAKTPADLPQGAILGSASLRRRALMLRLRPDLKPIMFRGNVDTRLQKIKDGVADATLLAVAGLKRLGMQDAITSVIPLEDFPPAPGQGAVCIEAKDDNQTILDLLSPLNHHETRVALMAERAFLGELDGSCRTPIAAHAVIDGEKLSFHGLILSPDGTQCHECRMEGETTAPEEIGTQAGVRLKKEAGTGFFESW